MPAASGGLGGRQPCWCVAGGWGQAGERGSSDRPQQHPTPHPSPTDAVCAHVWFRSAMLDGRSEHMPVSELAGGARIRHIFQEIFNAGLEELDPTRWAGGHPTPVVAFGLPFLRFQSCAQPSAASPPRGLLPSGVSVALVLVCHACTHSRPALLIHPPHRAAHHPPWPTIPAPTPPTHTPPTCRSELTDDDVRTAIKNSGGIKGSLLIPEAPFELLVRRAIDRLLPPALQCKDFVHSELLRIASQCAPPEVKRFQILGVSRERVCVCVCVWWWCFAGVE